MQGPGYFNTTPLFIIVTTPTSPPVTGLFVYSPTEAAGNLIFSIVSTSGPFVIGVSPTGDTTYQGGASYNKVTLGGGTLVYTALLSGGNLQLFSGSATGTIQSQAPYGAFGPGQIQLIDHGIATSPPGMQMKSPRWSNSNGSVCYLILWGQQQSGSPTNAAVVINQHGSFTPLGGAQLEIQNSPGSANEPTYIFATEAINTVTDTFYRFAIDPNGKMFWGSGSAAADTDLYRDSGGTRLNTDQAFLAVGSIQTEADVIVFQSPSTNPALVVQAIGAANPSFEVDCNGKLYWGIGGSTATDTFLSRIGIGALSTARMQFTVSADLGSASAPAAEVSFARVYADSNSNLKVVSPNGNINQAQQIWLIASGQTVNSLTLTSITGIGSIALPIGSYRVRGQITSTAAASATAGAMSIEFITTGTMTGEIQFTEMIGGSGSAAIGQAFDIGLNSLFTGTTFASTTVHHVIQFCGTIIVTAAGNLTPEVATITAAADTWTLGTGTHIELMPL